jgi:2'-5' RNA ligase/ribosomal protein S18 acetylase RimI-like enzyme
MTSTFATWTMITAMPRQRLGVALLVPEPIATEIDALRRAVGVEDVTRIAPHITLVPPVNVREDAIDEAVAVLQRAAASIGPLRLELGPVTSFAPVSPTIHLAVGGDVDGLRRLRDAIFVPPLERSLTHDFIPHVTLIEESDRIDEAVLALRDYRADILIPSVHLLRETDRSWRPIADAPLGSRPAVIGRGGLELELTTTESVAPEVGAWLRARWDEDAIERAGALPPAELPIVIVARRDDQIVGAAIGEVRPVSGEGYLAELMVSAEARNEGIGAHLLAAFTAAAAERDATYLTLRTRADGRARPFYLRHGFADWYPMPRWRNALDFVQMRKDL